jgi:hypothetical protein
MNWGLVLVALAIQWPQANASASLFDQKWHRESDRAEISVGRWLAQAYPADTRIIFDAYSYVPSRFVHVFRSVGMDYPEVNHFEPDVLIIRDAIVSDFSNIDEAGSARIGEMAFKDQHYFYR